MTVNGSASATLWRKARLLALLSCLTEPVVFPLIAVLLICVVPEVMDEGLLGSWMRGVFLAGRPLLVVVCVAFVVLGLYLRHRIVRRGLPPAVSKAADPNEKLRLAFMAYIRLFRGSMSFGDWVSIFGMLHFTATGDHWFALPLIASGWSIKLVFWPTKRRWAKYLGHAENVSRSRRPQPHLPAS